MREKRLWALAFLVLLVLANCESGGGGDGSEPEAPETIIDSGPSNPSESPNATFRFHCTLSYCTYQCKLDSGQWTTCTSPKHYTGLSEGKHSFQVKAFDDSSTPDPTPAIYHWRIKSLELDTIITAQPLNPSNSSSASFSFSCTKPPCTFECQLDSDGFSPCSSPKDYSNLSDGPHTFEVRASDSKAVLDPTPASYSWIIDTIPPDTFITSFPSNPSNISEAHFEFNCDEENCSFECSLDGAEFSVCTSPKDYIALLDGDHSFEVRALDSAGNIDPTPAIYNWHIETTAPDTIITSQPPLVSDSNTASFSFICTRPPCTFECELDSAGFTACSSPKYYSGLAPGSHNFQVRAIDSSSNIDPTPASYRWAVTFSPYNYFQIIIDPNHQVVVIAPTSFSPSVDYPGLSPTRISNQVSVQSWLNPQNPKELMIEVKNLGSEELPRFWFVGVFQAGAQVMNPDALNQGNQPILVFGPIPPGGTYQRTISLTFSNLPCLLVWDPLKIPTRVAYVSDYLMFPSWRIWTSNLSGKNRLQITNFTDPNLKNGRPTWSPGMEWIGFDYMGATEEWIAVIHPDGSHYRLIAENSSQINFSPDGKSLVYLCEARSPTSWSDICLKELSGGAEQILIRGDGYYWDGGGYQSYASSGWRLNSLYYPRLSPDARILVFSAQEPNLAPAPINLGYRWVLLKAKLNPSTLIPETAPSLAGKLFEGDTITTSNKFINLYDLIPGFTPGGQDLIGFLKISKRNPQTNKFDLDFYGLARIRISQLIDQPSTVYLGDYIDRIYDIRNFKNSTGALYINFQDYSPEVGGILFTVKINDGFADIYLLPVNSNFQPQGAPQIFISNNYFNACPRVAPPLIPGAYH